MELIKIDLDKCINCHRCIAVCPVKLCNDASNNKHISILPEGCIYCGNCIDACEQKARYFVDDFDNFLTKAHKELVFIVAPAVISSWGQNYKKIITLLKSQLKAMNVYDVSFGAELTIIKYEEFIREKHPKCVIAQPCPAVVRYLELYHQELLKYLAPVDSPAMAIARYLREFKNYKGEIAFLSPCIAKAEEFSDPNTGKYINYNITHKSLDQYIKNKQIDLDSFSDSEFDVFQAERAVAFSRPGGLKETILRDFDIQSSKIRKIEGPIIYEEYFDELSKNLKNNRTVPLVVDVLNCEKGCCFGPGTLKGLTQDEVDDLIDQRIEEQQKKYGGTANFLKQRNKLIREISGNPFERKYSRKEFQNTDKKFSTEELEKVYKEMRKTNLSDFKNCQQCGYQSCQEMATAILLGINVKENCMFFVEKRLTERNEIAEKFFSNISSYIHDMTEKINTVKMIFAEISNSFSLTKDAMENVNTSNTTLLSLAENFTPIVEAITDISDQTHLLSVNASIEAARAGEIGAGFAIVAHEVDKLSEQTASEVEKITPMVSNLIEKINQINKRGEIVISDLNSVKDTYSNFYTIIEVVTTMMDKLVAESEKLKLEP